MGKKYSEETIDEVISQSDIVDVIADYTTLKKKGNSYMGNCPFHNEKTPSFSVSREKQLYHCFGCGVGGNVVGFVKEMEHLEFLDAIEFLAKRANINLPVLAQSAEEEQKFKRRERLYNLQKDLANYFYLILKKNAQGQAYLSERGLSAATVKEFGIGLSPSGWQNGMDYLAKRGYTAAEMLAARVISQNDKGNTYDTFRGRIMFPIQNATGRIIGFGGRRFGAEEFGPKYLNSPETEVFSKGHELFNLNRAKKNSVEGTLFIVEGYMDVIALYEHGVKNAVAALGTAFTPYHNSLLSRYADTIILCFDGDDAGDKATQKALEVLKKANLNVKIMRLPKGEDPDSYINKHGQTAFLEYAQTSQTVMEYELGILKSRYDLRQTDQRITYLDKAIHLLGQLENDVERELYAKLLAKETDVEASVIRRQIGPKTPVEQEKSRQSIAKAVLRDTTVPKAYAHAQTSYVKALVADVPGARGQRPPVDYFTEGYLRSLYEKAAARLDGGLPLSPALIVEDFQGERGEKYTAKLFMDEETIAPEELVEVLNTIEHFHLLETCDRLQEQIDATDDVDAASRLMTELIDIKRKINA